MQLLIYAFILSTDNVLNTESLNDKCYPYLIVYMEKNQELPYKISVLHHKNGESRPHSCKDAISSMRKSYIGDI